MSANVHSNDTAKRAADVNAVGAAVVDPHGATERAAKLAAYSAAFQLAYRSAQQFADSATNEHAQCAAY